MSWPIRFLRMLVAVERLPAAAPEQKEPARRRGAWSSLFGLERLPPAPPQPEGPRRRGMWSSLFGVERLERADAPAHEPSRRGALSMLFAVERLEKEPEVAAPPALRIARWLLLPERLGGPAQENPKQNQVRR